MLLLGCLLVVSKEVHLLSLDLVVTPVLSIARIGASKWI